MESWNWWLVWLFSRLVYKSTLEFKKDVLGFSKANTPKWSLSLWMSALLIPNEALETTSIFCIFTDSYTTKWIRDWSIFSSKFPKQHDSLFDYSCFLLDLQTWNCFCFDLQNWQNNFRFTTLTKHGINYTNCCIALEILKKIWISLVFI